jgi:hypothetical protein
MQSATRIDNRSYHTNGIMGALLPKMNQQVVRLLCSRIKILYGYTPICTICTIWRLLFKLTTFDHLRNVLTDSRFMLTGNYQVI